MTDQHMTDRWYTAYDLGMGIWRISDHGNDNLYVIEGKERSMLIDTGYGADDLTNFVRKLTDKPLVVVNTHGHIDHACGNDFFDTVYAGAEDLLTYAMDGIEEKRESARTSKETSNKKVATPEQAEEAAKRQHRAIGGCPARVETLAAADGMLFDLGGRDVRILLTPGHSEGSLCVIDEATKTLFTGDTYVPDEHWGPMWLHLWCSTPLSVYLDSLCKMRATGCLNILSGHGECAYLPISRLEPLIALTQDILAGRVAGECIPTFVGYGMLAHCDGGGLIYSLDKL